MKHVTALIAAFIVTAILALGLFAVGVNAMTNQNRAPLLSSPAGSPAVVTNTAAGSAQASQGADLQAQVQQLQSLVNQYQAREKQYQDQLNKATSEVNQANSQLQEYQQLLVALQQRGLIRVQPDGTILVPRGSFGGDDRDFNNRGNNLAPNSSGLLQN